MNIYRLLSFVAVFAFGTTLNSQTQVEIKRISANLQGDPLGGSTGPILTDMSPDGLFVAYYDQTSLTGVGGSNSWHGYVRNIQTGESIQINRGVSNEGVDGREVSVSNNGAFVAYASDRKRIYVYNTEAGTTEWINQAIGGGEADGVCRRPVISADGRYVAYWAISSNVITDTNEQGDVYLYDRQAKTTRLATLRADGNPLAIGLTDQEQFDFSRDGRYIFFATTDPEVTAESPGAFSMIYRFKVSDGSVEMAALTHDGQRPDATMATPRSNYDGTAFAFISGNAGLFGGPPLIPGVVRIGFDVYGRNMNTGDVWLATATSDGAAMKGTGVPSSLDMNGDGTRIAFSVAATNLTPNKTLQYINDVFESTFDGDDQGTVARISVGPGGEEMTKDARRPHYAKGVGVDFLAFEAREYWVLTGESSRGPEQVVGFGVFPGTTKSAVVNFFGEVTDLGDGWHRSDRYGAFYSFVAEGWAYFDALGAFVYIQTDDSLGTADAGFHAYILGHAAGSSWAYFPGYASPVYLYTPTAGSAGWYNADGTLAP